MLGVEAGEHLGHLADARALVGECQDGHLPALAFFAESVLERHLHVDVEAAVMAPTVHRRAGQPAVGAWRLLRRAIAAVLSSVGRPDRSSQVCKTHLRPMLAEALREVVTVERRTAFDFRTSEDSVSV